MREMFLGKYSRSASWMFSWCPQWRQTRGSLEGAAMRGLRQSEQALCSQEGIMRGWLAEVN